MELLKSELHHVACLKGLGTKDDLLSLVLQSEKQVFVDGLYKNGPTMVSISLSEFKKTEEQPITVYIPVNLKIEEEGEFTYIEHLVMEKVFLKRLSLQDNLYQTLEDMQEEIKEKGYHLIEDKVYITFLPVFGDYWIDIEMQVEEDGL